MYQKRLRKQGNQKQYENLTQGSSYSYNDMASFPIFRFLFSYFILVSHFSVFFFSVSLSSVSLSSVSLLSGSQPKYKLYVLPRSRRYRDSKERYKPIVWLGLGLGWLMCENGLRPRFGTFN